MMDISKLTDAPWIAIDSRHEIENWMVGCRLDLEDGIVAWQIIGGYPIDPMEGWSVIHGEGDKGTIIPERADLEFIALSRNAFDVQMRRGWHAQLIDTQDGPLTRWWVDVGIRGQRTISHADPLTALIEADEWMKEHECNK